MRITLLSFNLGPVRNVPRVFGLEQLIYQELQHWHPGAAGAAGVNVLRDLYLGVSQS